MPKRGKPNKLARDRRVIAGLKKHPEVFDETPVGPQRWKTADFIAIFEEHAKAIEDIDRFEARKRAAVAREAELERGLSEMWHMVVRGVRLRFGYTAAELADFGVKPPKKAVVSTAAKAKAVERRRETRGLRGTMGPKQRKKARGG